MNEQAYTDGPNTHKYRDATFVTSWTLFRLTDHDGVEHVFHVPTRIVEQFDAVQEAERLTQPSRDTEIERIAAVLREAMPVLSGDGDTVIIEQGYSSDGVAQFLYDAGLRSQPASEPSLDVERLYEAIRRIALRDGHPGHSDLRGGLTTPGLGHGYEVTLAGAIAEEYERG